MEGLSVPGLLKGHRGPRVLAICGCAYGFLEGLPSAIVFAAGRGPLPLAGLELLMAAISVATLWFLVVPVESRDWFRPSTHENQF
ncbi:hypothetical protein [Actinocatenispora rupis]|uniref:Uncharacterized protein n=1 Tax=Actinocatenispora rupis TaxID=519421 RepID=A0A8J3IWW3_9ACTN|nr:hypothetical protein [Actinocatenispora rupis]GID10140.1 hypothetical protein Aru02nite_10290 [Actinocatenispora rupis]